MDTALLVTTTVERQEDAETIARTLLQKRLVACAQINGPIKSLYWWKENIAESVEFVVTFKTFDHVFETLEQEIRGCHPYDVPEIVAEPLVRISPAYRAWMEKEIQV